MAPWLKTPPGRYLLEWEQAQLDQRVADVFGFHAVQLGLPELDALHSNRMPHRWLVAGPIESGLSGEVPRSNVSVDGGSAAPAAETGRAVTLHSDFDALPFDSQSLDLVVMPHALEQSRDPHLALREVERVLRPEGRAVILGFNPGSLWGLRQRMGLMHQGLGGRGPLFLPRTNGFIGYWRLRDWLRLLSFEVEAGRFGCYGPPFKSERWLSRFDWMEPWGERWWPVLGAVYLVVAVKRVRGMRLVGLARKQRQPTASGAPVVSHRSHRHHTSSSGSS